MKHGGKRQGAGRPKGIEPTKAIRLPLSLIKKLGKGMKSSYPLFNAKVSAGLPISAEDYNEEQLDLNDYLIKHPDATFLVRATGDSMINAGIYDNDILIVDKNIPPTHGKIVIVAIDGQLTVKRLHRVNNRYVLKAENPAYAPIEITDFQDTVIWGVVTQVLHAL